MRNVCPITTASVLLLVLSGCFCVRPADKVAPCGAPRVDYPGTAAQSPAQVLRHVVLFKFKDDASAEGIRTVENAFKALPSKIDAIHDFEWGTDVSVENLAQGYTHCFFVTFLSEDARAEYLPHPDHKSFGATLGPVLDKVLVLDYWTAP